MKLEETSLTDYLLINLAPLTKADPAILAKYVTALLKKEKPMEELKKFCAENLVDFLGNGTELFVSELFKVIDKGSVVTLPEKLDVFEQVGVSLHPPTKDLPQPLKLRTASMKTGCSSSDHNLEKQGCEDDDCKRRHCKTETHSQSKETREADDRKLMHSREEIRSQYKEAREAFARKLKHCREETHYQSKVALKDDDHKRKRSRRETHPQSKEALKDDDRGHMRSRRETHPQSKEALKDDDRGHMRSRRETHSQSKRVRRGYKRKRSRRETHSQSLEKDVARQYLERPHRVQSEVYKNGKRLLGSDPPSSDNLKTDDSDSSRKTIEINAKLPSPAPSSSESLKDDNSKTTEINGEHPSLALTPNISWDLEMQSRVNPSPYADPGDCSDFSMGLGCNPLDRRLERTPGHWSQHHSRFSEYVFQDRELQTHEMMPWMPNGRPHVFHPRGSTLGLPMNQGMDALHPRGWQRTLGPPMNQGMPMDAFHPFHWQRTLGPPMSHTPTAGMPHKRCRDFEELGFCLKGDICPMDHGVDRITVEDMQSFSQLNLPVSLSRTNFMRRRARTAQLDSGCPPSGLSAHSNLIQSNTSKPLMTSNRSGLPKLPSTSTGATAVDLYDPDQPPWNNAISESSNALIVKHTSPHKALRTLYVSYIPPKENKIEPLLSHFQKFGAVDDIFITTDRKKAYIQFSKREAAEAAISSPDAVLGNRFIRLSWAYKDRLLELDESSSSTPQLSPQTSLASRQEDLLFELQEVNDMHVTDIHKLASSSKKKMGSLEIFTKEPRLKLELIDQNQSDFKPDEQLASSSQKKIGSSEIFTKEPRLKLELIDQSQSEFKPEEQVISVKTEENTEKAVEKHEVGRVPKAATKIPTNLVNSGCQQAKMKKLDKPKLKDLSDAQILAETVIPPGLSLPPSSIIRLTCNVASQATTSTDMEKLVPHRNINENCQNLNIVQ